MTFSFSEYIRSKTVMLCTVLICLLVISFYLYFMKYPLPLMIGMDIMVLTVLLAGMLTDHYFKKKKISELESLKKSLPDRYLIGELLPKPSGWLEEYYFGIMKTISSDAISVIEKERQEKNEYCDYVESWIHEIKTPLTACSLIISNDADSKKLRTELKRAENMTESILYYAKMRTFGKDTVIEKFDVNKSLNETVKDQMRILIASKISVEINGDFTVCSDRKALIFMVGQLLINCAKYCAGCHIDITAENGTVTVEDNGPGIPSHEIKRVTERGFTGRNRKTSGATGMGLYIVDTMCRDLDIDLNISSEEGRYTKISLTYRNLT